MYVFGQRIFISKTAKNLLTWKILKESLSAIKRRNLLFILSKKGKNKTKLCTSVQ